MNTQLLLAAALLLTITASACEGRNGGEDVPAGAASSTPASAPAQAAAANDDESRSPGLVEPHAGLQPHADFHPSVELQPSVDWQPSADKSDQVEFDLVSASHSAMVLVLRCDLDPESCEAKFDPESAAPIVLPARPHCGEGSQFDCSVHGSSFAKHRGDYYISAEGGGMSGSFIAKNRIITAAHGISDLDRLFFVMNEVQRGHHWPTVDLDEDGSPDHVRVDPRFVLAVDKLVDCEFRPNYPPDWAIFEVRPLLADQAEIPAHARFELAEAEPPAGTKIRVPAHPRLLPLKLADGVVTPAQHGMMTAVFDVSQGSSGSPVLLADQDVIVGINRVRSHTGRGAGGGVIEYRCSLDAMNYPCLHQPLSSATWIRSTLANTNSHRIKCGLKKETP